VCRNIIADASCGVSVGCSAIAQAAYGVIVVDLVDGCDTCAATNRAGNSTDYSSNRATGQCANSCATQSACNSTFGCVVVRIVVNSMLHIVICHVNHVSSEKFELATGLAETVPTLCEREACCLI
jgi:hypothetical protein